MADSVERLYEGVIRARQGDPTRSRTARLLRSGRAKMAKKLAEEAVEVVIDAMSGHTEAVVRESADLLYNLVVLWVAAGVRPKDVWAEMDRRERLFGIAEKVPKTEVHPAARRKVVPLDEGVRDRAGDPHDHAEASETEEMLSAGLQRLPRLQREVFLLRAQQGLEYDEIAAALGTTPGAARVHYHHAVRRLKEIVK